MVLLYALQLIAYKGEQCLWKMSVFSQQLAEMGVVYIIDTTYIGNGFYFNFATIFQLMFTLRSYLFK